MDEMDALNEALDSMATADPEPEPIPEPPAQNLPAVVRMMNPVIEQSTLDKSLLPTLEVACSDCPLAT